MKHRHVSVRRLFVVGCPRSGTTAVQAQLASLPGVYSLGETHFFVRLLGHFDRWLSQDQSLRRRQFFRSWVVSGHAHRRMRLGLRNAMGDAAGQWRLWRRLTGRGYARQMACLLDRMALDAGCSAWVEKTPDHLAYIDAISRWIPDARFLHVVRCGEDVVASAIDGQTRYPGHPAFAGGIEYWVRRWNRASEVHLRYAGDPRHVVLPYECLLAEPARVRALLAELTGTQLQRRTSTAGEARIANLTLEPWKQGATDGVVRLPQRKFENLFGPNLQSWIRSNLDDYAELVEQLAHRQRSHGWIAEAARRALPTARPQRTSRTTPIRDVSAARAVTPIASRAAMPPLAQ